MICAPVISSACQSQLGLIIVQYADDTLIVLPAVDSQLIALKDMLHNFAESTGLRVNFSKSSLILMNMSEEEGARIAALLGCSVGSMPFTYLGLPMGTSKPTIYDLLPLVDRIERRLSATSCLLNQGSRLQLLQSALMSMPIYFLCSLSIPQGILKQIERIERQCLWRGNTETPRQSLAAWELVGKPKKYGGLGVTHLGVQNEALLIKHLFKFFNKKDVPWVNLIWDSYCHSSPPQVTQLCGSFWWRDILKLYDKFSSSNVKEEISTIVKADESEPSTSQPKATRHVFQVLQIANSFLFLHSVGSCFSTTL